VYASANADAVAFASAHHSKAASAHCCFLLKRTLSSPAESPSDSGTWRGQKRYPQFCALPSLSRVEMRAEAKASWRSVLLLAVLTLPYWSIQTERRETEAIPKNQVKGESEQDDTLLQACSQRTFLLCKNACMHQSIFGFVERIVTGFPRNAYLVQTLPLMGGR
jgi:hypothetical protein